MAEHHVIDALGIDAEAYCRQSAVTTAVDAGTAGPGNFAGFRAHVIAQTQVNGNYHEPRAMKATAAGIAAVFEKSVD